MRGLCRLLDVQQPMSTAYQSQIDAQTENVNTTLSLFSQCWLFRIQSDLLSSLAVHVVVLHPSHSTFISAAADGRPIAFEGKHMSRNRAELWHG